MKLYWAPASPYARKVRVVAREKSLARLIEEEAVEVYTDPADLISANPLGKIPTLILDNGEPLYDSALICDYLDSHEAGLGDSLIPASGETRWRVLRAAALADGVMDLGLNLTMERRKPSTEASPTSAARWRGQLTRAIGAMMPAIAALPERVTLGHLALACALGYSDFRHPDLNWRDGKADLAAWYDGIGRRPSLQETMPR